MWRTPDLPGCAWRRGSRWDSNARQFSPEFKADAVALVRSTGRPIAAIAREGFKREVIDGERFATRSDARNQIVTWLNWYNQTRLHSSIGYCPPVEYEQHLAQQSLVA